MAVGVTTTGPDPGLAARPAPGRTPAAALRAAVIGLALLSVTLSAAALMRTPHNLSNLHRQAAITEPPSGAPLPRSASADSRQLCVFCHTPEAVTAVDAQLPPRWQRAVAQDYRFGAYVGELVEPEPSELQQLGHSMVCLSCHDAVQAPLATGRADDHPIGVPYRGIATPQPANAPAHPADSAAARQEARRGPAWEYRPPASAVVNDRIVWWASQAQGSAQRTRSDLPLFSRRTASADGNGVQDTPFVECGTCHDPHSSNALFLRVQNDGGRLCMTCHNK